MAVVLKTPDELERMRIAGRLASEVLDFITPHVKAGVTTGKLNDLCHDYMLTVQKTVPAPLNYAPPGRRSVLMPRKAAFRWCANSAATALAEPSMRSRRSCTTASPPPGCRSRPA